MKKLLLAAFLLFISRNAHAYDVYLSSSPAGGASSGVLCSTGTVAYLYSVMASSASAGSFTTVYASTFTNTSAQNTGVIAATSLQTYTYSAAYGSNGLFYSKSGGAQLTYTYLCN